MEDKTVTTKTVINQTTPNASVQKQVVSQSNSTDVNSFAISKVNEVVWFIISIIELFIVARLVLLLFGAKNTEFVSFIYSVGRFFIAPFVGIFTSPTFDGTLYFDTAALVGVIFWMILGFVTTYFISIFSKSR